MLCSLLENNKDLDIVIHILISRLNEENENRIIALTKKYDVEIYFHNVDLDKLEDVKFRSKNPLSKAAYYRLLLSSILPSINKILYLDVDMVVLGSVKPLFDLELANYPVAAVRDIIECTDEHRMQLSLSYEQQYFCSAIMMINLDYWRKNDSEEIMIGFSKRNRRVFCHDQDALNYAFKGKWFQLPPKWNKFNSGYIDNSHFRAYKDKYEYKYKPVVIHFSGYKPEKKYIGVKNESYYLKYFKLAGCLPLKYEDLPLLKRIIPPFKEKAIILLCKIGLNGFYMRIRGRL